MKKFKKNLSFKKKKSKLQNILIKENLQNLFISKYPIHKKNPLIHE